MKKKTHSRPHASLRSSQLLTVYGPGALFDLPRHAAIIGGIDFWPNDLEPVDEPRLSRILERVTGPQSAPQLVAPPIADELADKASRGITALRFPQWFVVQSESGETGTRRSRRLVEFRQLQKNSFEKRPVVATRFVAACSKGHIDDVDWRTLAHGGFSTCRGDLWLDELGTSGDLSDLVVRCECGKQQTMSVAADRSLRLLGACRGRRPWLQENDTSCGEPLRLLIRTASNAYFAQRLTLLSIPEREKDVDNFVSRPDVWPSLQYVETAAELNPPRKQFAAIGIHVFSDDEILAAIKRKLGGNVRVERPIKLAELDAILASPEGHGHNVPENANFDAGRLPELVWRRGDTFPAIEAVYQLHRLREVSALIGFTRFEPIAPDINGEYSTAVKLAPIASKAGKYPAVENRGEGVFLQLRRNAIEAWLARPAVAQRIAELEVGFQRWKEAHHTSREFPGGAYIMLHTLSHLLLQSVALSCGYPLSAVRERIYADAEGGRYGIMLYTGSPDSSGTLGGLVAQARVIGDHLNDAVRNAALCSNDPICAQHSADDSYEERWLHGAACHGCTLVGETSCEMWNDFLDRALVVPVLGCEDAAFFRETP